MAKLIAVLLVGCGGMALAALVFQLAWNVAAVAMFHAPRIGYVVALAAVVLLGMVTGALRLSVRAR